MSTVYPNSIDDVTTLPVVIDNVTQVTASTVNVLRFAIVTIEQVLGISPAGAYAGLGGVRARLDNVDTQITSLSTDLSNVVSTVTALIAAVDGEHVKLGTPSGGFDTVGIVTLQNTTFVTEAINIFNNIMSYLAPMTAHSMNDISLEAVTSVPLYSGKVSDVTGHSSGYFKSGFTGGSAYTIITKTQNFTLTTHDTNDSSTGVSDFDKGILTLNIHNAGILSASTFNLGAAFDESHRIDSQGLSYDGYNGNASPPLLQVNAALQVYSIEIFNSFPLWQKGAARIINTTLSPGYNTFGFVHTIGGDVRVSQLYELFYDNNTTLNPTYPSTPTLIVSSSASSNYLSGIKFLTAGSTLRLQATINNAFTNVYLQSPLNYNFTAGIVGTIGNLSDASITVGPTGSNSIPNSTDHITIDRIFTISVLNQHTINQIATITYSNVYGALFVAATPTNNILLNTYNTHISTNTTEGFLDEVYRLLPDINGASGTVAAYPNDYVGIPPAIPALFGNPGYWNATAVLTNGNAQVFDGYLIYPTQNFTSGYNPAQNGSSNYSGFNNTNSHNGQVYYRAMYSINNPRSTGTLTLGGISLTDLTQISPNIKVEMKLPGTTGWLNFKLPFNVSTFSGITGDGCRAGVSGSDFEWSTGSFSTATSGFMYILRITLFNASRHVSALTESFIAT